MIMLDTLYYYLQHADGMSQYVRQEAAYSIDALRAMGTEVVASGTLNEILAYLFG